MYDEEITSSCEGENIIYRLFCSFLKGKTKEDAIEDILKEDKPKDLDNTKEDE